ncbi:hypothetical protein OPV22_000841 [Ensete ventricosum]|uniref:HTH myb-type domain-containing protein n=1 Tax=Ensete ventricosum TaxID=4639 RepID=A0AAV8RTN6_ENSVE|nr:hypothetical protein OPV22_000841 [Ensete ventricosum]
MDFSATLPSCGDYVRALEEEREKIQVFQRELPLCLRLVTHAIDSARRQMNGHATMSEDGPILEEFIPLKPSSSSSEDRSVDGAAKKSGSVATRADEKLDWLRSVQLWNQEADAFGKVEPPTKPIAVDARRIGGAFHPFERVKHVAAPVPASSSTTSGKGGVGGGGEEKEKEGQPQPQPHRKARRCWSPELHQRFLHALKQLGGPHVATPKQVRELMKVDGLTNDEVKSHLQKFRLHNRRPSAAVRSSNTTNPPIPQFVVVSGIWVPPPDYTVAAPPAAAPCTPASLPSDSRVQPQQNKQSDRSPTGPQLEKGGRSEESNSSGNAAALNSLSPVTSSSSQTTTASHPLHRS